MRYEIEGGNQSIKLRYEIEGGNQSINLRHEIENGDKGYKYEGGEYNEIDGGSIRWEVIV